MKYKIKSIKKISFEFINCYKDCFYIIPALGIFYGRKIFWKIYIDFLFFGIEIKIDFNYDLIENE